MTTMEWILFVLVAIGIMLHYIYRVIGEGVDAINALRMDVRKLSHREMPAEWSPD